MPYYFGGVIMVKAENIRKIKEDLERYKMLLENEVDLIKILKYRRLIREQEYKLIGVDIQLNNIEIFINKDGDLHKKIFIDRYIYNVPVEVLVDKYNVSRVTVYRILKRGLEVFEKSL